MKAKFIQKRGMVGSVRTEVYGMPYGATTEHYHSTSGFPVGSHIPGGRFVVDGPSSVGAGYNRDDRMVILPDRTGTNLLHNDGKTDYSEDILDVLKNDEFKFIGVSGNASHTCKDDCIPYQCCPIGYPNDAQRMNYWPKLREVVDIITMGMVSVYAESDISVTDDQLYVRVEVLDDTAVPCQLIGGVTAIEDAGTQALGSNVRIEAGALAGEAVLLELGGMSKV